MPPLPQYQTAVQIKEYGGSEVLQVNNDVPIPKPGDDEVLVKNTFAGVNYVDTYFRTGLYKAPEMPHILGREGEGHVVAIGSKVTGYSIGDRVTYLSPGSQAQFTAVSSSKLAHIPENVKDGVAAASILQGLTALTMIKESYPVKNGDTVLVHAAAGGVGLWLCQLLKETGATTIATASTDEKLALAKENGADYGINYSSGSWKDKVLEITGGKGVEAVFDGVGKDTFDDGLEVLARKGTFVSFGNASGPVPPVSLLRLAGKNLKITRAALFNAIVTKEEFEYYAGELLELLKGEKINVKVHEVYPLSDIKRAHDDIEGRKTTGKLLVKI